MKNTEITIHRPVVFPDQIAWMRNYRSKPHEPWVLVIVKTVKSGWHTDGTVRHQYHGIRLNSPAKDDFKRGTWRGKKEAGGAIALTVGEDRIAPNYED